jgi:hypothetical protein
MGRAKKNAELNMLEKLLEYRRKILHYNIALQYYFTILHYNIALQYYITILRYNITLQYCTEQECTLYRSDVSVECPSKYRD